MSNPESRATASLKRLVVVGVGLIGGSFALALKRAGLVAEIVGLGRREATLERAQRLGVIDWGTTEPKAAVAGADMVFLAMPVGQTRTIVQTIAPHLAPETIVTDAGSTKQNVVEAFYLDLPDHLARAVPGHPIAGKEQSGPDAADAALFVDRKVVLTPLPENDLEAVARVTALWAACGAEVRTMTPQEHDRVFAAVSHLPHVLSYALVHELAGRANAETLFDYAAGGFRDFTRIAGSHPEMWRDICLANRQTILAELDEYLSELAWIRALLLSGNGDGLYHLFAAASEARNRWAVARERATEGPE
ncbi:MAG: prephenate dehydrogenase [Hydrogenophilus thermoluteolus]|nr:prephenate dehydrogenase/arogenate dehydrogenase family protein [Hydrogenophilus thermoluteolus]MBW7656259.1 prephenate dehydrogenase/arogenate dehydrogenase family protein [Hydrogenophilus thermoluteolus]